MEEPDERHERPAYDTRESSYAYAEDDLDDYPRRRGDRRDKARDDGYGKPPYPSSESTALVMPGAFDAADAPPKPTYRTVSPPPDSPYRSSREKVVDSGRDSRVRFSDYRVSDRRDEGPRDPVGRPVLPDADERFKTLPQKYSKSVEKSSKSRDDEARRRRDDDDDLPRRRRNDDYDDDDDDDDPRRRGRGYDDDPRRRRREDDDDLRPQRRDDLRDDLRRQRLEEDNDKIRRRPRDDGGSRPLSYREAKKAQIEEDLAYGVGSGDPSPPRRSMKSLLGLSKPEEELIDKFGYSGPTPGPKYPPPERNNPQYRPAYDDDPRQQPPSSSLLVAEPGSRIRDSSRDRRGSSRRDKSPQPPTGGMSMLSVGGAHPANMSLAQAPPSPLLESYYGTYQQSSPMPSPLMLPQTGDLSRVVDVAPLESDDDRRINRRARFHDPEEIARRIADALKGDHRAPNTEPLLQILPGLSHDEVMELRTQYKAIVKAGSSRKGVNVAKHIRSRLRDEDPNLMKACYAVALGQWESEAYWANFWYQGDKTRRELLLEALMGRTNEEIRLIKDGFQDKKYGDSLSRCMKTELKEDKFKKAVMMVLSEERMEEEDGYGRPLPLDRRLVDQDVDDLRRAVKSEKGGESLMLSIVVLRSDSHLREVLREYSAQLKSNFARDALKKSTNLVVSPTGQVIFSDHLRRHNPGGAPTIYPKNLKHD